MITSPKNLPQWSKHITQQLASKTIRDNNRSNYQDLDNQISYKIYLSIKKQKQEIKSLSNTPQLEVTNYDVQVHLITT